MRSASNTDTVRLYYLDDADLAANTLFYGPLIEALAIAREQPEAVQAGLWIETDNDLIAYLDLEEG
jgi:hypothetical protein